MGDIETKIDRKDVVYVQTFLENSFSHEIIFGEECGVFGVYSRDGHAPMLARNGVAQLQHRGQEAAGESVFYENGQIRTYVDLGMVPQVLTDDVVKNFGESTHAISHNRYTTNDKGNKSNAQPIPVEYGNFSLSFAHNGNFFDTSWYGEIDVPIQTPGMSDSNKFAAFVLWNRLHSTTWNEAIKRSVERAQESGAISGVVLTNNGDIFAVRDPFGIRPLSFARSADGWMISSEDVATKVLKAQYVREVNRGEIIHISKQGTLESSFYGKIQNPRKCTLERIYFSRPDSFDENGMRLKTGREKAGEAVAARMIQKGLRPNVVVPIKDSGEPAAHGIAKGLGVPEVDAILTSHYVGRTFIMPGQSERKIAVNGKHNVIPEGIQGQDIVMADDSVVRATTAPPLVADSRESGAIKSRLGITAPPVTKNCDLGVDMPDISLIAAAPYAGLPLNTIEEKIAFKIGADSVTYLPITEVARSFQTTPDKMCYHCFGGPHPIRDKEVLFRYKERPIEGLPKIMVFISGNGTNLEKLIERVEDGDIEAQIIGVISNKEDAYGLVRAQNHGIPAKVISSKGMIKDEQKRHQEYMPKLKDEIEKMMPDIIVFAGFMVVLDDQFLTTMQDLEITGINLHPALLTQGSTEKIVTTRGEFCVIRGAHAIEEAYQLNIPVSGVTVHQLLPNHPFDTGPIILKEEVQRNKDDTFEKWEAKIHEAEYRVLPTALKRVIHALKHNIDISKGDFPW